ncbi:MAG: hypothetical protein V4539_17815 [Bacteroidota bacterium]
MQTAMSPEIREVLGAVHYMPSISIIMPFEPKMNPKAEISHALKLAVDKIQREVSKNYPNELGRLVIQKLRTVLENLNFSTHKKSIAIYVSPVFEKVLYLDIAVEEKIIVDESFEIRDLVYSKKQLHKYLVLVLTGKESRIYLGSSENFVRIVSNTPVQVNEDDRHGDQSDNASHKEILMDKFLHQVDQSLDIILNAYHLPLFLLGTEKIAGHFMKLTKHKAAIVDYIHGSFGESTIGQLQGVLQPHVADWKQVKQKEILNRLDAAQNKHLLAAGIHAAWREALNHKGSLLVVEKNYMYASLQSNNGDAIYPTVEKYSHFSYIKDAVDDVIEKVLENGGDVEFVEKGLLDTYDHIALIQRY